MSARRVSRGGGRGRAVPMVLVLAVLACAREEGEPAPPEGYRALTSQERSARMGGVTDPEGRPDLARGDFDGDGMEDTARLWVAEEGEGWLVLARLSSRPDQPVEVVRSGGSAARRVIRTIPPGEHRTHRFYGIGPGEADTTAIVTLPHAAIGVGPLESEGRTWMWDAGEETFVDLAAG